MPATLVQLLDWPLIEAVLKVNRLTLLYGPPGTGKTTAAVNAGRALKRSVYNVTLTDETPAAELRGHWIPGETWTWKDGPAFRAYRDGGLLVLNEIDKASLDCLDFLHALLDDSSIAQFELPSGETVFPHDDFTVVATTNGTPQDLPDALADRFAAAIYVGTPHPDAVASLPEDLRDAALNSVGRDTDELRPATLRRWKAYAGLRDSTDADIAGRAVFAHRASEIADALALGQSR